MKENELDRLGRDVRRRLRGKTGRYHVTTEDGHALGYRQEHDEHRRHLFFT